MRPAQCSCMAGLGETCSHVAGLLFKIEAAVRTEYAKTACTDEPCQRNVNFVIVELAEMSDIEFPAAVV